MDDDAINELIDDATRDVTETLRTCFMSDPGDYRIKPSNVVDGLYAIANAMDRIANAITEQSFNQRPENFEMIAGSLDDIAAAIQGEHEK